MRLRRVLKVCFSPVALMWIWGLMRDDVALREAVANFYNETHRVGKASQYTYENVCAFLDYASEFD